MSSDAFENARALAGLGFGVLPLYGIIETDSGLACACGADCGTRAGKHPYAPLVPHGLCNASVEAAVLARWDAAYPDANWAAVTGGPLLVLDQDGLVGAASLGQLTRRHHDLPETWTVSTGRVAGRHYYYRLPDGVVIGSPVGKLGKGIDVRCRGSYAVIPGSRHYSGFVYEWHKRHHPNDFERAMLPDWAIKLLLEPDMKAPKPDAHYLSVLHDGVGEGERHVKMASLTGRWLSRGLPPAEVLEVALAVNARSFKPPLPEDEVDRIVADLVVKEAQKWQAAV